MNLDPQPQFFDISWWASILGIVVMVATIVGWFLKVTVLDKFEAKQLIVEEKRNSTENTVNDIKSMTTDVGANVTKVLIS